jgi:hypothetical protein
VKGQNEARRRDENQGQVEWRMMGGREGRRRDEKMSCERRDGEGVKRVPWRRRKHRRRYY